MRSPNDATRERHEPALEDPRLLRAGPLEWLSNLRRATPLHLTPEPLTHLERLLAQTDTSVRRADLPDLSSRPDREGPRFAQRSRLTTLPPLVAQALIEAAAHGPTLLEGIELAFAPLEWLITARQHLLDPLSPAPLLLERLLLQLGIGSSIHAGRVDRYPILLDALPSWLPRRGNPAAAVALLEALAPGRVASQLEALGLDTLAPSAPGQRFRFGTMARALEPATESVTESVTESASASRGEARSVLHSVSLDLTEELLPVLTDGEEDPTPSPHGADSEDEEQVRTRALNAATRWNGGEILICRSLAWYGHRLRDASHHPVPVGAQAGGRTADDPAGIPVHPGWPLLVREGLVTQPVEQVRRFPLSSEDVRVALPGGVPVLGPLLRLLPTWACIRLRTPLHPPQGLALATPTLDPAPLEAGGTE